jgi:hypothetical protein
MHCRPIRTLLTVDTATGEGTGPFYENMGFIKAGIIPDYALMPFGGLCGTIIYFKRLAPSSTIA